MKTPEAMTAAIRATVVDHIEFDEDDGDSDLVGDLAALFQAQLAQHEQAAQLRIEEARAAAFREVKNRIAYWRDKWDMDSNDYCVRAAEALLEDIAAIEEAAKR